MDDSTVSAAVSRQNTIILCNYLISKYNVNIIYKSRVMTYFVPLTVLICINVEALCTIRVLSFTLLDDFV